jgi:hypothetical protein
VVPLGSGALGLVGLGEALSHGLGGVVGGDDQLHGGRQGEADEREGLDVLGVVGKAAGNSVPKALVLEVECDVGLPRVVVVAVELLDARQQVPRDLPLRARRLAVAARVAAVVGVVRR